MSDPLWTRLREHTQARIGLGRAGNALPTAAALQFRAAHAAARDAVHSELDVDTLLAELSPLGLGPAGVVASRATTRDEYLRRPDLGRIPSGPLPGGGVPPDGEGHDVAFVLADGLSAAGLQRHGVPLARAIVESLGARLSIAPPVVALRARVALGDHIGAALGASLVLVIIGERPGLSVPESVGVYLTHAPRPGRTDAERNCVSNVHPPEGLGYADAARIVGGLVTGAFAIGASGVRLKDRSTGQLTRSSNQSTATSR